MNLPNKLTLLRILIVPLLVLVMLLPEYTAFPASVSAWIAAVLFVAAGITDTFDGSIARARHLITDFGKFMDPIADKLLTCTCFIMLTYTGKLHPVATIIFIARELIISGFRLVAAAKGVVIAADSLGKVKTLLQMIFIPALILSDCIPFLRLQPYYSLFWTVVVWITVIISVVSCIRYMTNNKGVIDFHDC